ncbi:MAG: AMP-binding protein [Planctomycetes bacterium]|nr:AMP-binding protein [Planctomycetota bacterium]MCB9892543.1 AMP-binding protein [Planctomycetota bacterium]MCB9919997.1 AMP-binding protein [Planctomycetota bacterium]
MTESAYSDRFTLDALPPRNQWPDLIHLEELGYPERLNVATVLLDEHVRQGNGAAPCVGAPGPNGAVMWTYEELRGRAHRIAHVLRDHCALVPGERVLLRAPNTPMLVACYLGVLLAGGVVVASMPLLRAKELEFMIVRAKIRIALCDSRLVEELSKARGAATELETVLTFGNGEPDSGELERLMATSPDVFDAVDTSAEDPCLIAFTSGTTGNAKGTMHFHRDLLAVCDCFPPQCLRATSDDIFIGSPPLAFTFGTGGLMWFPMRVGASTVLLEQPSPKNLAEAIESCRPTICVTSPTAYRMMLTQGHDLSSLRHGISAGETLPRATYESFLEHTGVRLIDGIGSTEMLHIFISSPPEDIVPGSTGRPVRHYEAKVIDEQGERVIGQVGRLAVRGPTGCRYLDDPRQLEYVHQGWNLTGDAYVEDENGNFWYQARTDDMIVSAGYNIAGPEVESALMLHPAVQDCAVVGVPDEERGHIVKAFVVANAEMTCDDGLVRELQAFVKETIAPYKYPRAIEFLDALPRTATGKVQRYVLRTRG